MASHASKEHRWFAARLEASRLGLLPDDEESRYSAHLAECPRCRRLHKSYDRNLALDPAHFGHIPPSVLGRWPRAQESLAGVERAFMRRHLEACEVCRAILVRLGYEPALGERAPVERRRGPADSSVPRWPVPRRWITVWAGLATAASLFLALRTLPPKSPATDARAIFLTSTRGQEENLIRLDREQHYLLLCPPPMTTWSGASLLRVTLRSESDQQVFQARVLASSLANRGGVLVPVDGLTAGWYTMVFALDEDPSRTVELQFRISRD